MREAAFVVFYFLSFSDVEGAFKPKEFTSNVTAMLNGLLLAKNYDKKIRPDFGGPPAQITVNMAIKSLGPVVEDASMYSMDVYFRQSWYDRRLKFSLPGVSELSMSWLFLEKIWKPDTYFLNGKKSHLHKITSPNKFVRMRSDGHLTYSMRLTLSATCKMHLRKFPLDSQVCRLVIGSYGYSSKDMLYSWDSMGARLEKGVGMAQYDVVNISSTQNVFAIRSTGNKINNTAVTTVLSITTLGFGGRSQLPKVGHATALDWYVILCFAFAFAVMVEYAVINFTDKLAKDIKKLLDEKKAKEEKEAAPLAKEEQYDEIEIESEDEIKPNYKFLPKRWYSLPGDLNAHNLREFMCDLETNTSRSLDSPVPWFQKTIFSVIEYWKGVHFIPQNMIIDTDQKFHKVDMFARRAFPLAFVTLASIYALLYTYYITDKDTESDDYIIGVVLDKN